MNVLHYHGNDWITIPLRVYPWGYQSNCVLLLHCGHSVSCSFDKKEEKGWLWQLFYLIIHSRRLHGRDPNDKVAIRACAVTMFFLFCSTLFLLLWVFSGVQIMASPPEPCMPYRTAIGSHSMWTLKRVRHFTCLVSACSSLAQLYRPSA